MSDKTHLSGLNDKQVEASRAKYGANVLTPPEREPCGSNSSKNSRTPSSASCW